MTFPILKHEEMKLVSSHDRGIFMLAQSRPQRSGQETHLRLREPLPAPRLRFRQTKGLLEPALDPDPRLQHLLTGDNEIHTLGRHPP